MTNSIRKLLESAGVPVTDELLKEFGTADDAAHPALRQAMKAKRAAEREEKEADFGGMEPPKDYAEEDEDEDTKVFDKKSLPFGGDAWPGLGKDKEEDSGGRFERTVVIGKGPEGSEAEKMAYSVAKQLRSPEDGIHTSAGVNADGWFVKVAVNK